MVESIIMGSDRRLRGTMMTDLVDALGFLPTALSTRIGARTQRPLAMVVIGGALAIALLTRLLQPVLIYLCHRRLRLADRQGYNRGAIETDTVSFLHTSVNVFRHTKQADILLPENPLIRIGEYAIIDASGAD